MRSFLCVSAYALVAVGLCVAAAVPANAGGCNKLIGTADGWNKPDALSGAQSALAEAVAEFKKGKGAVTVTGMRAKPHRNQGINRDAQERPHVRTPSFAPKMSAVKISRCGCVGSTSPAPRLRFAGACSVCATVRDAHISTRNSGNDVNREAAAVALIW